MKIKHFNNKETFYFTAMGEVDYTETDSYPGPLAKIELTKYILYQHIISYHQLTAVLCGCRRGRLAVSMNFVRLACVSKYIFLSM